MLELRDIHLTLGRGTALERKVLNQLTLTVQPEEFVVIIGGNGAGKSTLLNVLSGFLKVDQGQILLDGQDLTNTPQRARASLMSKVMQDPRMGTLETMTIFENMAFAFKRGQKRRLVPFLTRDRKRVFQEKLQLLPLELQNRLDDKVETLSGGQRQALSLLLAFLADSKILLLDEITAALDPQMAEKVMQLTCQLIQKEGLACLMITHNMTEAIRYGNRLLILKEGRFVQEYKGAEKHQLTPAHLASTFGEI